MIYLKVRRRRPVTIDKSTLCMLCCCSLLSLIRLSQEKEEEENVVEANAARALVHAAADVGLMFRRTSEIVSTGSRRKREEGEEVDEVDEVDDGFSAVNSTLMPCCCSPAGDEYDDNADDVEVEDEEVEECPLVVKSRIPTCARHWNTVHTRTNSLALNAFSNEDEDDGSADCSCCVL